MFGSRELTILDGGMPSETNIKRFIAILVNPLSGNGRAVETGKRLSRILAGKEITYQLFNGDWPATLDLFTEAWIVGGDGTINYFINQYFPVSIPLAVFKGGTGNDFAWKLYGDISLQDQVELVLTADPCPVDAGRCNGKFYLNSLGIGFDGRILNSMKAIRWLGGHMGYWFAALWHLFSFGESIYEIKADETVIRERFLLVIINNSSRTGGGFMVSPKASVSDGKLDMILCKPLTVWKRILAMPLIQKGKHLDHPYIRFAQHQQVLVQCEKEMPAALDGELLNAKNFEISVLPGSLHFKYSCVHPNAQKNP